MNNKIAIYILVPRIDNSSPIKGAIALCNELSITNDITLVDINKPKGNKIIIDPKIKRFSLHRFNFVYRIAKYKNLLKKTNKTKKNISISYCLLADVFNSFCRNEANIISSIRGNYNINYVNRFSVFGFLLTHIHFYFLNKFPTVFVMNNFMKKNVQTYINSEVKVFGNFIDEKEIKKKVNKYSLSDNKKNITFCFIGRLVKSKKVDLLIKTFANLNNNLKSMSLLILGDGPEFRNLITLSKKLNISESVKFRGYTDNPINFLLSADCLVIPSISEGTSRAALEALFLGVPCILRDRNGNNELIKSDKMGSLFIDDQDLEKVMSNIGFLK